MNKYLITIFDFAKPEYSSFLDLANYGLIEFNACLWKNQCYLYSDLSYDQLSQIPLIYKIEVINDEEIKEIVSCKNVLTMKKIKKCPFCGGNGILRNEGDWGSIWIQCENCGAEGSWVDKHDGFDENDAINRWNQRV